MTDVKLDPTENESTGLILDIWREEFTVDEDTTKDYSFSIDVPDGKKYKIVIKAAAVEID